MPGLAPLARRAVRVLVIGLACGLAPVAWGQGCLCGTAADEHRAAAAGLVREWIVQVPFNSAASRLERVVIGDGLVVAQSGDGGMHAILTGAGDVPAGTVAWSRTIDAAAGHAWAPTIGSQLVVVASELAIHAVDRTTGAIEWERPTGALTAAAAVQSGNWVYVPLRTHRLLRLPVDPLGPPRPEPGVPEPPLPGRRPGRAPPPPPPGAAEPLDPVSIDSGGAFTSAPLPLANGVTWTTADGFAAIERKRAGWGRQQLPETPLPTWRRRAALDLAGPPVLADRAIFIVTADGSAARIDLGPEGRPLLRTSWAVPLPDPPAAGPLVSGDVMLLSLGPAGIVALSTTDGRERWRSPLAGTLVAVAGGRAWLLDEVGRLTALDLATGSRRQSLCLGGFTLPVVNTLTERLVLASPGGLVVSLAPPPAPAAAAPVSDDADPAAEPAAADPAPTPP